MKKLHRNMVLGMLGTTFGLYMMAAPVSVYAKSQETAYNAGKPSHVATQKIQNHEVNKTAQDPVGVVKASAGKLGFNAKTDSFSLVSKSGNQAVVSVRHGNAIYNVNLKLNKDGSQWTVVSVKKVKDVKQTSQNNNNHHSTTTNNSSSSGTTSSGTTTTTTSSAGITAAEQKAIELLNSDRQANGLSDLQVSTALSTVARNHAKDMVARNFFSHTNPDGATLTDRLKSAGISYSAAGENIAENQSVEAAETALMNSSGHRANILNSTYTTVGIGIATDSQGNLFIVQDFVK